MITLSKYSLMQSLASCAFGGMLFALIHYLRKRRKTCTSKNNDNQDTSLDLLREQLKRNYEYFGEEGMKLIANSHVCVVGIGGVGSHTAMTLIRSGIRRLRVIDYDIVTLSSLNRHAFAQRSDVGKLKVRVVKEYAKNINPNLQIDAIDDAFTIEYAAEYLLKDKPDYVIDCIDDLDAKCELIKFCDDNNLRLISSMGAGAKCDPSCVRVTNLHLVQGDKLAKKLRYMYKTKFKKFISNIKTVYSIEKSNIGLTELEVHRKEDIELHRINENERVRSLPVFASIPAIFGQALASVVLTDLANMPIDFSKQGEQVPSEVLIGTVPLKKLIEDFIRDEVTKKKVKEEEMGLSYDDFYKVAESFNFTSAVSMKHGNKMKFCRWLTWKKGEIDNIVLMSKSEHNKHLDNKNEEELMKYYGEEAYDRITQKLKELK